MQKLLVVLLLLGISSAQDETEVELGNENDSVKLLDLSGKDLTSLGDYDFSKYRYLEEVDLSNNDLTTLDEDTFASNANLKKLNLSGNKNLKLPEYSTLLIANIEQLNLSNCNLEELPMNVLDGMVDLKVIDLSENPLQDDGIHLLTITALLAPQEFILPHMDEDLIRKICDEVDVKVTVKNQNEAEEIKCRNVRSGKWVPKEIPVEPNESTESKRSVQADQAEEVQAQEKASDAEVEAPKADEETPKEEKNKVEETTKANEESPKGDEEAAVANEETSPNENISVEQDENAKEENTSPNKNADNEISNINEEATPASEDTANAEVDDTTDKYKEAPDENQENVNGTNVSAETKPDEEPTLPETPEEPMTAQEESIPNPNQRSLVPVKTNETAVDQTDTAPQETQPQKAAINEDPAKKADQSSGSENAPPSVQRGLPAPAENESRAATSGSDKEGSSIGSNVLVFLVVAVVVAGLAAFGYKFYKSRQYQAASPIEPMERELKEIVVERPNGVAKNEEQPLMEPQRHTEAKEEGKAEAKNDSSSKGYVAVPPPKVNES